MAKTDFSSSSPLAGSFLTGLICPSAAMLCRGGLFCIRLFFAAMPESLLRRCFILRRGLLCLRFLHNDMGA